MEEPRGAGDAPTVVPDRAGATGVVRRLGVKSKVPGEHGLPKPEVAEARLTAAGLEGDFNLYRQTERKGDPDMAVLLIPEETLAELNADGWPVRPGDLGENLTTAGIPYGELRPRTTLLAGEAVLQTRKPCEPCTNLYLLPYVGPARGPEFLKATLGRRGWFARVVRAGTVRRGDAIRLVGREP